LAYACVGRADACVVQQASKCAATIEESRARNPFENAPANSSLACPCPTNEPLPATVTSAPYVTLSDPRLIDAQPREPIVQWQETCQMPGRLGPATSSGLGVGFGWWGLHTPECHRTVAHLLCYGLSLRQFLEKTKRLPTRREPSFMLPVALVVSRRTGIHGGGSLHRLSTPLLTCR